MAKLIVRLQTAMAICGFFSAAVPRCMRQAGIAPDWGSLGKIRIDEAGHGFGRLPVVFLVSCSDRPSTFNDTIQAVEANGCTGLSTRAVEGRMEAAIQPEAPIRAL